MLDKSEEGVVIVQNEMDSTCREEPGSLWLRSERFPADGMWLEKLLKLS